MPALVISGNKVWDFAEVLLELYCNIYATLYSNAKKKEKKKRKKEKKEYGLFPFAFSWVEKQCGQNKVPHNLGKTTDHVPALPKLSFGKNNFNKV